MSKEDINKYTCNFNKEVDSNTQLKPKELFLIFLTLCAFATGGYALACEKLNNFRMFLCLILVAIAVQLIRWIECYGAVNYIKGRKASYEEILQDINVKR